MKKYGRLLSKINSITLVPLTAVTLLDGSGTADLLEISCKSFIALINPAVGFSKAFVAFPNVVVRFSDMAPVAFVVLVNPLVAFVAMDSVALEPDKERLASVFYEDKL